MLTDIPSTARFLVNKLKAAKDDLGLVDIFYGDQDRIPRTPAVCVEPGEKTNEDNGAPRRVLISIDTYILVYHNPVTSTETIREQDDNLAAQIETFIHADPFFKDRDGNDQVISSLVTRNESGYQQKKNSLYRASRLTVQTTNQEILPSAFS